MITLISIDLKRSILDFSNTELVNQINFSNKNDYYVTTMNGNLVIAFDYGDLLDDIKELSTKSWLLLDHHIDLSLIKLALSFPGMGKKVDEMYFFVISRKYGSL